MRSLADRERKFVAVFILCLFVGVVWLLVVAPVLSGISERRERKMALSQQFQANQRIIGSIPRLRRQAEQQKEALGRFIVAAPNAQTASATMQERLQRTIEATGGETRAIEDGQIADDVLRMRATARLTLAQLTALLVHMQNEPPYLTIETLNVTADQALVSGRLEIMEVSFEISLPVVLAQSH
ncbi:type II secretion system protein GspM [Sphingomonas sp.]|uniref:type II secretion system protein GspM n=1 Tax=Sphingomonas sp. TaxID=28214 RepID=UPI0025E812EE|nr:type II secretion system protein GspM [Sphingomonas sp.]